MSTEDLERRLHAAGERWRASNTAVACVDLGHLEPGVEPFDVAVMPTSPAAPKRRWRRVTLPAAAGVAAAVAAILLAVSVGRSTGGHRRAIASASSALIGVDWRLVKITGPEGSPLAISATLTIDEKGTLSGTDGCNHFSGRVTIDSATILLAGLATTEMGCLNPIISAQSNLVDAVLTGTVHWSVRGDQLTLSKTGRPALGYRAVPRRSIDPKALVGVDWQLSAVAGSGPDAASSTPAAPALLRFDGHNHLSITDSCNDMGASVIITAGRLVGGGLGGTLVLCSAAVEAQENLMRSVLTGTARWWIQDGQLTLSKAGVGTLVFTWQR